MRTTVTLDADTEQLVRRRMRERGMSFKEAINDAIRQGAGAPAERTPFRTETARLGVSRVNLDRALQVAADLEDDELVRRVRRGS
jgi:DNA-binding GntR family transcriptional regulator